MPTRVRSYSKINLGLAIGAPRPDGFHALSTLYQTLALHDLVTVTAQISRRTNITLTSTDPRVPLDARNTAWKMVDKALARLGIAAEVTVHIQKSLPIQGGLGAGSANAAAALIGLERELGVALGEAERFSVAAAVGSDVPLFLLGGAVVGSDRGQLVTAAPDITLAGSAEIACVLALPPKGVSTPLAFRDWDRLLAVGGSFVTDLHNQPIRDKVEVLSRTYASVLMGLAPESSSPFGETGISSNSSSEPMITTGRKQEHPENQQGLSREQRHNSPEFFAETHGESRIESDLAENSLLALVRTGIENDFETVVFPHYPLLRDLKRHLKGNSASGDTAVYTALSGSGSVLFGLYRSQADAMDAQRRLHVSGVEALVTTTMPRTRYWSEMFAE